MNKGFIAGLVLRITLLNKEDDVHDRVQDAKSDYIDPDSSEEYDFDLDEAYIEQGRGEAETQVITELINEQVTDIPSEYFVQIFTRLAEHYELTTN